MLVLYKSIMYYGKVITFWIKKQYNTSKILSCYIISHIYLFQKEIAVFQHFHIKMLFIYRHL